LERVDTIFHELNVIRRFRFIGDLFFVVFCQIIFLPAKTCQILVGVGIQTRAYVIIASILVQIVMAIDRQVVGVVVSLLIVKIEIIEVFHHLSIILLYLLLEVVI
jgi:hypothetical protein